MTITTIQEAVKLYIQDKTPSLSPSTLASDYRQLLKWVDAAPYTAFSDGRLLLTYILQQEPRRAAHRVAIHTKALFRWAAMPDIGIIDTNPVASYRLPKQLQNNTEVIVIPPEEVPVLLTALNSYWEPCPKRWALWSDFQLQTGLRTGEVRAVHLDDIHDGKLLVHRNWTMHGLKASTKTNKRRYVPLNAKAQGILAQLAATAEDGFLFPWSRNTFMGTFHNTTTKLHKEKQLSAVYRPYDLRHTALSAWLSSGLSVATVAQIAGNSPAVIWAHYAGADKDAVLPTL